MPPRKPKVKEPKRDKEGNEILEIRVPINSVMAIHFSGVLYKTTETGRYIIDVRMGEPLEITNEDD